MFGRSSRSDPEVGFSRALAELEGTLRSAAFHSGSCALADPNREIVLESDAESAGESSGGARSRAARSMAYNSVFLQCEKPLHRMPEMSDHQLARLAARASGRLLHQLSGSCLGSRRPSGGWMISMALRLLAAPRRHPFTVPASVSPRGFPPGLRWGPRGNGLGTWSTTVIFETTSRSLAAINTYRPGSVSR